MRRYGQSFVGLFLAAMGLALLRVWWPAAVGVTWVALIVGMFGQGRISVPRTRAAALIAVLAHGVAVAVGTGQLTLGLAALPFPLLSIPWEPVVRRFGYHVNELIPFVALAFIGLVLAAWPPSASWWAAAPSLALILFFGTMGLDVWRDYRINSRQSWGVAVGDAVPDFRLPARAGRPEFSLSEQRGSFVFLQFSRGDWCPHCHVVMRIFHREAPRLAAHRVKVVVITSDEGADADELATMLGLDYSVLVDPNNVVARQFGALQSNTVGGKYYPLPASFLIGPDGTLLHASRPDDVASFLDPAEAIRIVEARAALDAKRTAA